MKKQKQYVKLTAYERNLLAIWKSKEISNKECARRLGRSSSTIGRELKRNCFRDSQGGRHYVAIHAQAQARVRERKKALSPSRCSRYNTFTPTTPKQRPHFLRQRFTSQAIIICI